jgi:hypothetical protein
MTPFTKEIAVATHLGPEYWRCRGFVPDHPVFVSENLDPLIGVEARYRFLRYGEYLLTES